MKKINILMVVGNTGMGGAQAFIMNVLRNIDRSRFQIDLAINYYVEQDGIEDECRKMGCRIHIIPYFKVYNYFAYRKSWDKLLANSSYDIVYAHSTNSASIFLSTAKKYGCKTIAHSHSAGYRGRWIERIVKKQFVRKVGQVADYWFACSDKAALRLYGPNYRSYEHYYDIPNAIDVKKCLFNEQIRNHIRELIGVNENEFLCGHVGTFSQPKNHKFIIEIFAEVIKQNPTAKLVCCGAGILMPAIKEYAKKLGVFDKIIFTGVVANSNEYMMAMDCLVFPSLFEGFPVTILEAEATGLPVVMSDVITNEVDLTNLINRMSLSQDPGTWANKILSSHVSKRDSYNVLISGTRYDIKETIKFFEKLYINLTDK